MHSGFIKPKATCLSPPSRVNYVRSIASNLSEKPPSISIFPKLNIETEVVDNSVVKSFTIDDISRSENNLSHTPPSSSSSKSNSRKATLSMEHFSSMRTPKPNLILENETPKSSRAPSFSEAQQNEAPTPKPNQQNEAPTPKPNLILSQRTLQQNEAPTPKPNLILSQRTLQQNEAIPTPNHSNSSCRKQAIIPKVSERNTIRSYEPQLKTKTVLNLKPKLEQSEPRPNKIKVDQKFNSPRLHSTKIHTNLDGSEINWDTIPDEKVDELKAEYLTRFKILKQYNSKYNVELPDPSSDLKTIVKQYRKESKRIRCQFETSSWHIYITLFYYGIEAFMTKVCGVNMFKGFGDFQSDKIKLYYQSLVELGELWVGQEVEKEEPWMRILKISVTQTLIFIVAGFISKWINHKDNSFVLGMINKIVNRNPTETGDLDEPICTDKDEGNPLSAMMDLVSGVNLFSSSSKPKKSAPQTPIVVPPAPAPAPEPKKSSFERSKQAEKVINGFKGADPLNTSNNSTTVPKKSPFFRTNS